jgi:hypothetical protein
VLKGFCLETSDCIRTKELEPKSEQRVPLWANSACSNLFEYKLADEEVRNGREK